MTIPTRIKAAAPRLRDERGVALAVAIFAIVIIGMLVAGVFYASYLEQRTGENTLYAQQAFEAAESGMADAMSNWNQSVYGAFPVDTPQALASVTTGRTALHPDHHPAEQRALPGVRAGRATGWQRRGAGPADARHARPALADGRGRPGGGHFPRHRARRRQRHGGRQRPHPGGWTSCPAPGAPKAGVRTDGVVQIIGGGTTLGNPPNNRARLDRRRFAVHEPVQRPEAAAEHHAHRREQQRHGAGHHRLAAAVQPDADEQLGRAVVQPADGGRDHHSARATSRSSTGSATSRCRTAAGRGSC